MNPFRRWRTLRHRRLQTTLATIAMATAVALPVTLLSVGGGVATHEIAALERSGFQVTVSAPGIHGIDGAHGLADRIDALAQVSAASPVLSTAIDVAPPGGGPHPALAEGVIPRPFLATEPPTQRGLFPSPLPLGDPMDTAHFANGSYSGPATNAVMVSSPFAAALGVQVGAVVRLSPNAAGGASTNFTVTGIFGLPPSILTPVAADAVVLPLSDLQLLTGVARSNGATGQLLDSADTIEVALVGSAASDPSAVDAAASRIQALVPYYGVTSLTQQSTQLANAVAILDGFYLALSSVALAVGILFLTLILIRRVESERGSIAVRRAIGVPARQIAGEIMVEGGTLAAMGSLGGLAAGVGVVSLLAVWGSATVAHIARLAIFDPVTLVVLVLGVTALSLPASAVATRAALRLSVPEALR